MPSIHQRWPYSSKRKKENLCIFDISRICVISLEFNSMIIFFFFFRITRDLSLGSNEEKERKEKREKKKKKFARMFDPRIDVPYLSRSTSARVGRVYKSDAGRRDGSRRDIRA